MSLEVVILARIFVKYGQLQEKRQGQSVGEYCFLQTTGWHETLIVLASPEYSRQLR